MGAAAITPHVSMPSVAAAVTPPRAALPARADEPTPASLGLLGREALGSHPVSEGNAAELLVETAEWLPRQLADLRAAPFGSTIMMHQYNWEPTGPGLEVAEILKTHARNGSHVIVSTDKHGSFGTDSEMWRSDKAAVQKMFDDLEAAGVQVLVNNPTEGRGLFGIERLSNPLKQHLDHRKFLVINNAIAYEGGMGLAGSASGKYDTWHDLMLRVEGPAAAQLGAEYVARATEMGAEFSPETLRTMWQTVDDPARAGAAEVRTVANHPGIRSDATDDFYAAANAATERLWVMTPYIGDEDVVKTLLEAKRRNPKMDVRVLVPGMDVKQNPLFAKLSQSYYAELIEGGVEVYGYERMMHAKAWLADDTFTIGSTNLSRGSLSHYMELSASVRDAGVAAKAVQMLEADFSPERRMSVDDVDGVGLQAIGFVRRLFNLWF
ncbi:MAG: cardiolipin synthetase [Thermoleophilia bacterium]|nr:cardiolipin synthetase [Thermoleophilia bacterium]